MLNFGWKVTKFFPYETLRPDGYAFELQYNSGDCVSDLRQELTGEAKANGINAHIDNKIGFEITNDEGQVIRLVFWDWVCYIIPVEEEIIEEEINPLDRCNWD